jgi:hypothetical protein
MKGVSLSSPRKIMQGLILFSFVLTGCSGEASLKGDSDSQLTSVSRVDNDPPCRRISQLRVTHSSQLSRLENVCEVQGALFIYADDIHSLAIPRLQRVGSLTIETENLQAMILPNLENVGSFTAIAPGLSLLEVPKLKIVEGRFYLKDLKIQYLDLNQLMTAEQFHIENCRKLEFIFADNITKIKLIQTKNSPQLAKESEENLRSTARYQSVEELQFRREQQQLVSQYRASVAGQRGINQTIRTTGHSSQFDSFGNMGRYFQESPAKFQSYEDSADQFKFRIGYQINDGGFGRVVWNLNWFDFLNR